MAFQQKNIFFTEKMICLKKSCNWVITKKTNKKPCNLYLHSLIQFNTNTAQASHLPEIGFTHILHKQEQSNLVITFAAN